MTTQTSKTTSAVSITYVKKESVLILSSLMLFDPGSTCRPTRLTHMPEACPSHRLNRHGPLRWTYNWPHETEGGIEVKTLTSTGNT